MALALGICLSLASCGRLRDDADANTVTFLIESMPISLDPRIGTDAQSEHLHGLIFDSLVARDAQMNVKPDLATSWDTPDPLTYVFHLRQGVKFSDGTALNAAAVVFNWKRDLAATCTCKPVFLSPPVITCRSHTAWTTRPAPPMPARPPSIGMTSRHFVGASWRRAVGWWC